MVEKVGRQLIVRGRVQGVFFRDWTVCAAREAGVAGWVRNRPDGTVEIHAEGRPASVETLIRACHDGPPAARVDDVAITEVAMERLEDFVRRSSG